MWTREATKPVWQSCVSPYSFYHQFIEEYWSGGPSEGTGAPIHRLCTLARKMDAASFMIDDCLGRADVDEEIAHLEAALEEVEGSVRALSVTFLRCPAAKKGKAPAIENAAVIGQATIIAFPGPNGPLSYIFEAIMRLPCKGDANEQLLNNHVPISGQLKIDVRGQELEIPASYFCQQNGVTSICAHCAIRTLVRTLTDHNVSVPKLNEMWQYGRDSRAVQIDQVQEALNAYGLRPVTYNINQQPGTVSKWGMLALLADSSSPALLMLSSKGPADHVVPILGHTFNSDEWHPLGVKPHVNGQNTMSSINLWIDHLVIHDDMLGPYYCLSRAGLFPGENNELERKREAPLEPTMVVAIVPDGVRVSPLQAEDFARIILPDILTRVEKTGMGDGTWWNFFQKSLERKIFRTTRIMREEYIELLRPTAVTDYDDRVLQWLGESLAEQLWMCEISLPNLLLANRAKLGELLISAEDYPLEDDPLGSLCAFRLPSLLGWQMDGRNAGDFAMVPWAEQGHQPIRAPLQHPNRW